MSRASDSAAECRAPRSTTPAYGASTPLGGSRRFRLTGAVVFLDHHVELFDQALHREVHESVVRGGRLKDRDEPRACAEQRGEFLRGE